MMIIFLFVFLKPQNSEEKKSMKYKYKIKKYNIFILKIRYNKNMFVNFLSQEYVCKFSFTHEIVISNIMIKKKLLQIKYLIWICNQDYVKI